MVQLGIQAVDGENSVVIRNTLSDRIHQAENGPGRFVQAQLQCLKETVLLEEQPDGRLKIVPDGAVLGVLDGTGSGMPELFSIKLPMVYAFEIAVLFYVRMIDGERCFFVSFEFQS